MPAPRRSALVRLAALGALVALLLVATGSLAARPAATPSPAVFEGRLITVHGDARPAPVDEHVLLETSSGRLRVQIPFLEAFALSGRTVRIAGSLQAGVIVPAPGASPEVVAAGSGSTATATASGTGSTTVAAAAATTRKVAVIAFDFADLQSRPWTTTQIEDVVLDADRSNPTSVRAYYEDSSDAGFTIAGAVLGWYRLDVSSASGTGCDYGTWATLARQKAASDATAAGLDLSLSTVNKVYLFPDVPGCGWAGLGELPGSQAWISGYLHTGVIGHELGHNFGVHHASTLACTQSTGSRTPITARTADDCTASEYGDPYSLMGDAWGHQYTHNAWHRAQLGYTIGTQTVTVTAGLDITAGLTATEPAPTANAIRLIRIVRPTTTTSYLDLELRGTAGSFDTFTSGSTPVAGVSVRIGYALTNRSQSRLLDGTPATTSFADAQILPGASMWDPVAGVRISVLSVSGGTAVVRIQAEPDSGNPAPPSAPTASAVSTPRVVLSWGAATDDHLVAGYEVRRNGTRIAVVKSLTYTDCAAGATCSLVPGSTYDYDIVAYDGAGKLSAASRVTVTVPPTDLVAPGAPGDPTLSDLSATSATLGWGAAVDDTGGSGIGGYEVFLEGGATPLVSTAARTATLTGLTAATGYSFVVRAYDAQGNRGPFSAPIAVTTEPAPVAPSAVSASASGKVVTVSFVSADGYASYEIRRETIDPRKGTVSATATVGTVALCLTTCTFTDTLSKAGTYRWSVRARNGTLSSGWTASASGTYAIR